MNDPRDFGGRTPPSREPDERLADWVDGCMGERERERFTAELRVNPQLRADLAAYERTVATLREALQAPTAPLPRRDRAAAGTTLADRVLAQAAGQAPGRAVGRSWRHAGGGIAWRPVLWSLASAAALLLLTLLLDSWSAEPPMSRETTALSLDESTAATGTAMPLEPGIDPGARFSRESAAAVPGAPKPEAAAEGLAQELAPESAEQPADKAKHQAAGSGAEDAAKPALERSGRDRLELPGGRSMNPDAGGDQREDMERSRIRARSELPAPGAAVAPVPLAPAAPPAPSPEAAPASPVAAASDDPRAVDNQAGSPAPDAPSASRGQPPRGGQARMTDAPESADRAKLARFAPGSGGVAVEEPTPTPAGTERDGARGDSPRAGGDVFYLGSLSKEAVVLWPLLLIEGVDVASGPAAAGGGGATPPAAGKSRDPASGPAGPASSAGPASPPPVVAGYVASGPSGPSSPGPAGPSGGVARALDPTQLLARIDAFLADAVRADAAPVVELSTATGTLRLVRLPAAEAPADRVPPAPEAKATPVAAPVAADWAVVGPEADVAVLLRRVDLFARASGRSLSSGEVAAPTLPTLPPAPTSKAAAATASTQRQLVLRFRIRAR